MDAKIVRESKIAEMIYKRRTKLGLTQFELARELGYKHGTYIGQLESGRSYFPFDRWRDYARILQIDEKEFLRTVVEELYPDLLPFLKE